MNTRRLLIASFVFLAPGIYLLCAYCNGTTGFQASDSIPGNSLTINITTTGYPEIAGLPLTLFGLLLLALSVLAAIVGEIRAPRARKKVEELASSDGSDAP